MTQDALLKLIAESGYNIGYAAKKHLATLDIVEKVPGWIGLISIGVGIYTLFIPALEQKPIAAAFILIGIASLFINFYMPEKEKYAVAGNALTGKFHDLRALYQLVKSQPATASMDPHILTHQQIQHDALELGIPKQIFLSDWYAHYKFFWQAQIAWIDEQLHFRLIRDKIPLGFTLLVVSAVLYWGAVQLPAVAKCIYTLSGK
jgi:hypothetical protein